MRGLNLGEEYAFNILVATELGLDVSMQEEAIEYITDGAIWEDKLNMFVHEGIKAEKLVSLANPKTRDNAVNIIIDRYFN